MISLHVKNFQSTVINFRKYTINEKKNVCGTYDCYTKLQTHNCVFEVAPMAHITWAKSIFTTFFVSSRLSKHY